MGIFSRWKHLSKPRVWGSGRLWDNTNTPGGKGWSAATRVATQIPQNPYNFARGLNPNSVAQFSQSIDASHRYYTQIDALQPVIPWRYPRGPIGNTSIQNAPSTPGQPPQPPVGMNRVPIVTSSPTFTQSRDVQWDTDNPITHRIADSVSQQYFNQRTIIELVPQNSAPTHAVQTNIGTVKRGWFQSLVPEPGMSANNIGSAPPYYLSKPLNVRTVVTTSADAVHRTPIKAAAPKRRRTV